MDLGTIQYNVEADTTDIDKANAAVDNMAEHMDDAGKSADNLGKKITNTGNAAGAATKGVEKASGAVSGFGASAGRAGIQIQQFVGQIQGGQNAFVALSQQAADLGFVLGAPLVGVIVSLGAVIGGVLYESLGKAKDNTKELEAAINDLHKGYKDLDIFQKQSRIFEQEDKQKNAKKQIADIQQEINKLTIAYEDLSVKGKEQISVTSFGGQVNYRVKASVEELEAAERKLIKARGDLSDQNSILAHTQREIQRINGIAVEGDKVQETDAQRRIKQLEEESIKLRLKGAEIAHNTALIKELTAAQADADAKSVNATKEEQEKIRLLNEQNTKQREANDAETKARSEREAAAKRIDSEEKTRAENVRKAIANLKEEADLYGEISREAKIRFDIENGLIKVKTQAEKDALITQAKRIDQLNDEKALQEAIDAEIKDREDETKKAQAKTDAELKARSEKIADLINDGLMRGFESGKGIIENFRDTVENVFKTLVLRPSIEIATAELSKAVGGVLGSVGKRDETGKTVGAQGLLGKIGANGVIGLAIGASFISSWNAKQDAKFAKLESAYRQGVQSTGTVFGEANKKSESIANAINSLGDTASNTLDVNYEMYQALLDIREGISGVAAGFARTINTGGLASQIKTGKTAPGGSALGFAASAAILGPAGVLVAGISKLVGGQLGGFVDGIIGAVSKAIYSKKTSVINSGIKIMGTNLADILEKGTIEAFSFADVKTTKKLLGVTTSNKVKENTEAINGVFESQFAQVFKDAGSALESAAKVFATEIDPAKLIIDTTKLSLKGLEGDALTKEIENFFSSTLDSWAEVLVGAGKESKKIIVDSISGISIELNVQSQKQSEILKKYQKIGEGAFETVVRLATETNTFASYADKLNFNFNLVGLGAIEATQNIAELSGGFDKLSGSLANYYRNFFSDSERTAAGLSAIGEQLKTIGIDTVPKTREAFRALVEDPSIDLASESGQKYFATLISLSGAFAELVPATKDAANATEELTKKLNDAANAAFDALSRSIDAERDRISTIVDGATKAKSALEASVGAEKDAITQAHNAKLEELKAQADAERAAQESINKARIDSLEDQKSAIEDSVKGLQSLIGGINNAINDMAVKSNALTAARRRAAEFEIETALRNARAGRLPTMESLSGAIGAIGGGSSTFSSFAEMARATAITQNQLKAISDIAGTKLSSDEQMLAAVTSQLDIAKSTKEVISTKFDEQIALENDAYEKQIASLDLIVQNAQTQYDVLTGIDTKTLSLTDAIAKYNDSLLAADFTNAEAMQTKLDEIKEQAKSQVDVLNGIDVSVLTLNDSFIKFADAINAASTNSQKEMLDKMQSLVDEVSTLRSQSLTYSEAIAKNTGSTAANTKSIYKDGVTIIETVPA